MFISGIETAKDDKVNISFLLPLTSGSQKSLLLSDRMHHSRNSFALLLLGCLLLGIV